MVAPKENSFCSHLSMSAESIENSHCYKSTKFLATPTSGSHKEPEGVSSQFYQIEGGAPFIKKKRKLQEEKRARGNLFKQRKTRYEGKSVTKFSSLEIKG